MASADPLDPSAADVRRMAKIATDFVAQYLGEIRDRRVYPETTSAAIRGQLDRELPQDGAAFDDVLRAFEDVVVDNSRHNGHPRMFGYVQSPGTAVAAFADLLASALNANLTAWRSAPAAVEVERLTIDWIKEIVGFAQGAAGLFVSGGSMANMAAIAAARHAKAPKDFAAHGVTAMSQRMCIYASQETHHSVMKAAALLGIGRDNVRLIAVNDRYKIDLDELVRAIGLDKAAGHLPFCVVANAGTVATGAFDPIADIAEIAQRFDLWMHVDGAYGGFAMLAPGARPLFSGIERADSIALDPHKWLYLPVDCGCVLYRDPENARATFAHDAEYTRVIGHDADETFAFWNYGPELSRRFRALKVWMVFQCVGTRALGEAIEKDLACARHLESLVHESDDFEMLAPVELSIFCFRHRPTNITSDAELNAHNERLLLALQRDGTSYLSNAMLGERFALRGCVMNYRTTPHDMKALLDDLRRVAAALTT